MTRYPLIKVIDLEKPSSFKSRIAMFYKAKGDYVLFVDSDDKIVSSDAFSSLVNEINKYGCPDILVSDKTELLSGYYDSSAALIQVLLSSNRLNSLSCKLFSVNLKPVFPDIDIFQSDDKILSLAFASAARSVVFCSENYYWIRPNEFSGQHVFKIARFEDLSLATLFIEEHFGNYEERYIGYADALRGFLILFIQAYCSSSLNRQLFSSIYANSSVRKAINLFKIYKKTIFADVAFTRRLAFDSILREKYWLLKTYIRMFNLLNPNFN